MASMVNEGRSDIAKKKYQVEDYQLFDAPVSKLLVITLDLRTIASLRHQHITGMAF
jgi:hypothetical protein